MTMKLHTASMAILITMILNMSIMMIMTTTILTESEGSVEAITSIEVIIQTSTEE